MKKIAAFAVLALAGAASADVLLFEDFNSGLGSFTNQNATGPVNWVLNTTEGRDNWTGGTGTCAHADSDRHAGNFDVRLVSPVINIPNGSSNITLSYLTNYQNFALIDFADTDVRVNGGAWQNILRWNEDHGTFQGLPGVSVSLGLDAYAGDGDALEFRFRYYELNNGGFDWWWSIDDVSVTADVIPAPSALALFGFGAIAARRRRA